MKKYAISAGRLPAMLCVLGGLFLSTPSQAGLVNPLANAARSAPGGGGGGPRFVPCKDVPPVTSVLGVHYYTNSASSEIDPQLLAANKAAVLPLNMLISQVTHQTESYLASRGADMDAARCVISTLDSWASANALSGDFNLQSAGSRQWAINAAAIDYLAVSSAPGVSPAAKARIGGWFDKQAHAMSSAMGDKSNNLLYWAAAAVAAASVAANDQQGLNWAINAARTGIAQIGPDGSLPQEIRRQKLAMHYHVFALEPLVEVAGLAKANGVDLYAENNHAISRLAKLVVSNMDDQSKISQLAGMPQVFAEKRQDVMSWAEQYFADTHDCTVAHALSNARPVNKGYIGGNTTLLYGQSLATCR